jgi:hypothetical protein
VLRAVDLVMRFIYVLVAPLMLAPLAAIFPIKATLIGAGLATAIALFGSERWTQTVGRIPVLGRVLGGMGRLGAFYREHPPKPLVYYILYPLLLPVILFRRVPRREFLLYRKLNAIALVVVIGGGALDYVRNWRPELTFKQFLAGMIATLILQLLATFALVMPIVTTLVMFANEGRRKLLWSLVALAALTGFAGVKLAHSLHGAMQISTWQRLRARTNEGLALVRACEADGREPKDCLKTDPGLIALARALDKGWEAYVFTQHNADAALGLSRDELAAFYKPDEVDAFENYFGEGVEVLYVHGFGKAQPLWLARDKKHLITLGTQLPAGAVAAMTRR